MLKFMRDSFQHLKWILVAIVAIFILFIFVDWGGAGSQGQGPTQAYAAKVNGETISTRDYERAKYFTEENYKRTYGAQYTPEMAQAMGIGRQVLESLVDQKLLLQEASRLKLSATPDEVRKKILAMPVLNPDGKFVGNELYTRFVTAQLQYQSTAEFEEDLARQITIDKIESALTNSVVVSPKAAEAEYRHNNENAKIRYVMYPASREAAATVTPAEVDAYYKQNQARYAHGEQRDLKYLVADLNKIRSQITPTDAEIQTRYDASKEDYKNPEGAHILHILIKVATTATPAEDAAAKAKAEGLAAQIRGGADFAALAKANSQDPSSAANGGDMGFVDRGVTVAAFENAAFTAPLNTVQVVRTPEYGYHIIKVTERRAAGYRPLAEVRSQISAQMVEQQAKDQARNEITRISERLKEKKPKTAEEFAAFASGKVTSNDTQWFQKSDSIPGLGNNSVLTTWAFSAKQNDTSDVIGTQRGPAIAFVSGIRPSGLSSLDEIRARVEADAKAEKAKVLAKEALAKAMTGAANIDAVGTGVGIPAAETTITRQGYGSAIHGNTNELMDAAMRASVGQLQGPIIAGDGAVAFQVLEQKKVDPAELKNNQAGYLDTIRQSQARNLRKSLLIKLRKGSKIEINPKVADAAQETGA